MNQVCGVIVTYNRKDLLVRNIESLCKQTIPIDILIVDNASTDGTYNCLKEKGIIDMPNVFYHLLDKNTGGAGGFYTGEKLAYQKGYEYVWLMDDDGFCLNDTTLEVLLNIQKNNEKCIVNSYVACDDTTFDPTFEIGGYKSYNEASMNAINSTLLNVGNPYNSTLVSRKCFEEVGFTDYRFFIYGDEADFFERTSNAGYTWITALNSLYYHPINRNTLKSITICGKELVILNQPIWKLYLEMRNVTINSLKYQKKKNTYCKIMIVLLLKAMFSSFYAKEKKIKRIHYALLGITDGKNNYFDRPIPFKE